MLHLKRLLWLTAWSVWLWLGFGLYRELPRDLGPVLCTITKDNGERPIGFLPDGQRFVTVQPRGPYDKTQVRVRDVRSGAILKELDGPNLGKSRLGLRGELLQSLIVPDDLAAVYPYVAEAHWILDVETGRRVVLGGLFMPSIHSRQPWALISNGPNATSGSLVQVVDFRSGRIVFSWPRNDEKDHSKQSIGLPFFIDDDRLAISVNETGPSKNRWLEVWRISDPSKPVQVVNGLTVLEAPMATNSGRILWQDQESLELTTHVFDLAVEKEIFVFPDPPPKALWPSSLRNEYAKSTIASNGKTVLERDKSSLWEIDTHRILWQGRSNWSLQRGGGFPSVSLDSTIPLDADVRDQFEVAEDWLTSAWNWNKKIETFAVRRLTDGSLVYRSWVSTLDHRRISRSGDLLVDEDWKVRQLPPRLNYFLLALCQTILALPLVLTWALLCWRRRRAERRSRECGGRA